MTHHRHPDLEKLLLSTRDHYTAYHNHKEQMAYAATTVYLGTLAYGVLNPDRFHAASLDHSTVWAFYAMIGFSAWPFVIWQLRNRQYAADFVQACNALVTRLLKQEVKDDDLVPAMLPNDPHEYPQLLVKEVEAIRRNRSVASGAGVSACMTYGVMALGTAVSLWVILR